MLRFLYKSAYVLFTIACWMQVDGAVHEEDICSKAPKAVRDIMFGVQDHAHYLFEEANDGDKKRRCCGKYGCFNTEMPYEELCRANAVLPQCQDELEIKFFLWTKKVEKVIILEQESSLQSLPFDKDSQIAIFINGFLGGGNMDYIKDIKDAMLMRKPELRFISVDWVKGSRQPYNRALANTQIVGAVTAELIHQLQKRYGISPGKIHLIGVNLGAHAAGFVGKRLPGIDRITGLDPTGFRDKVCSGILGISMTDANFVDIIHADVAGASPFGSPAPRGHLDIYVNGGLSQPACMGCPGCTHTIVILYFLETIRKPHLPYRAFQCDSYDNFLRGNCPIGCNLGGTGESPFCASMGYAADKWRENVRNSPTLMFMTMGTNQNHYHSYHYHVEVNCTDKQYRLWKYGTNFDQLEINVIGKNGKTGYKIFPPYAIAYTTLPSVRALITSDNDIGDITGAWLKWTPKEAISGSCENVDLSSSNLDSCTDNAGECRCSECPYILESVVVKRFEYGKGKRFTAIRKAMPPGKEVQVGCDV